MSFLNELLIITFYYFMQHRTYR